MRHCSEELGDRKWALPLAESQLIAIEEHGCYQGLGRLVAIRKILPSWDH